MGVVQSVLTQCQQDKSPPVPAAHAHGGRLQLAKGRMLLTAATVRWEGHGTAIPGVAIVHTCMSLVICTNAGLLLRLCVGDTGGRGVFSRSTKTGTNTAMRIMPIASNRMPAMMAALRHRRPLSAAALEKAGDPFGGCTTFALCGQEHADGHLIIVLQQ